MNHGWRDQALREFEHGHALKPFVAGETPISPSGKVVGATEIANVLDAVMEGIFTEGPWVTGFEQLLAAEVGVRYASMCNSGSSANLLVNNVIETGHGEVTIRVKDGHIDVLAITKTSKINRL